MLDPFFKIKPPVNPRITAPIVFGYNDTAITRSFVGFNRLNRVVTGAGTAFVRMYVGIKKIWILIWEDDIFHVLILSHFLPHRQEDFFL